MEYTIPYAFQQINGMHIFEREILAETYIPREWKIVKQETKEKGFGYELALRSSTLRIFTWILRYWHEHSDHPELFTPDNSTSQLIHSMKKYVEQNLATATLPEAAKACSLSYSYFSRIFKHYMHTSFSDYVNLTRVNQAMRLLATTEKSITEIAYEVGFSSASYFIQIFHKLKYTSPKQFRKLCSGKGDGGE